MERSWANSSLDLHLDLDPGLGRRAGLERALRAAIRDGRLASGARLPASRALATELGVARGTVTAAYDQLVAEGFLVAGQGSGTVVAELSVGAGARETPASEPGAPALDLRPGSPDVSAFPTSTWLRATRRALTTCATRDLGYGDPRGSAPLRVALAEYLGRTRGVVATADDIVVTTGFVQSLSLLSRATGSGPVAMENPNLGLHRDVVSQAGRDVVALAVDQRGARTELLGSGGLASCDMVVVTPAHQYPLGIQLAPERRHALVAWARQRGGLVVEDDYDGEFRYDRQPVGALQGMAPDHVAYVGTASKTLAPGIRLGWIVLPQRVRDAVAHTKQTTDAQTSAVLQLTVADMIGSHEYDRHVRSMRLRYRRRRDLLLTALERRTGRHTRGLVPTSIAAGLQTVIGLPDEDMVVGKAADAGLALTGLSEHFHGRGRPGQGIVVGFATPSQSSYGAALDALVSVLP